MNGESTRELRAAPAAASSFGCFTSDRRRPPRAGGGRKLSRPLDAVEQRTEPGPPCGVEVRSPRNTALQMRRKCESERSGGACVLRPWRTQLWRIAFSRSKSSLARFLCTFRPKPSSGAISEPASQEAGGARAQVANLLGAPVPGQLPAGVILSSHRVSAGTMHGIRAIRVIACIGCFGPLSARFAAFRRFRDGLLGDPEWGGRLVELFYAHSAELSALLLSRDGPPGGEGLRRARDRREGDGQRGAAGAGGRGEPAPREARCYGSSSTSARAFRSMRRRGSSSASERASSQVSQRAPCDSPGSWRRFSGSLASTR